MFSHHSTNLRPPRKKESLAIIACTTTSYPSLMPDFFETNNSGLSNETNNVYHTKKIPRDWLHPNKLNEQHVKTVYSRELTAITCEEERNSFIEQELQK